jgi:hypothetical protein
VTDETPSGGTDLERLREAVTQDAGTDPGRWHIPAGYPALALCVLDSIYSTGNRYTAVVRMLDSYRGLRSAEGADASADGPSDLVAVGERWGGAEGFAERTGYRWRAWANQSAPLKAAVALEAAALLDAHGLRTVDDVRAALTDPDDQERSEVKRWWLRLPGQRSGITWGYFLMLAGVPGVKADRMVVRYTGRALGRTVSSTEAAALVGAMADELGVSRTLLDHAIWRLESGRSVYVEAEDAPVDRVDHDD